jgi:RHS repeat-associated protein
LADGSKVGVKDGAGSTGSEYLGSLIYQRVGGALVLESTGFGGGRINVASGGSSVDYYITDHLGSTRVIFNNLTSVFRSDFTAFGTRWTNGAAARSRYQFASYEDQTLLANKYSDAGARLMNKKLPVYNSIDRFAYKEYPHTPYNYARNNPILNVDPTGDSIRVYIETERIGHAWISTGEGDKMTVYSYGRYDGTSKGPEGSSNSVANGPGVLLKLSGSDGQKYNEEKAATTNVSVYVITDVTDESVSAVLDAKFNSSENMPGNPNGKYHLNPSAHVIDDYKLLKNNCTTVVSDALNAGGSKVFYHTTPGYPGKDHYDTYVVPSSLQTHLHYRALFSKGVYKSK